MTAGNQPPSQRRKRCAHCKREYGAAELVCSADGTILEPIRDQESLVGKTIAGKYAILSEIGRGGMSIVYKANHELMDRMVAIKMLQAKLITDQTSTKRFQQEAKAASCLTHTNVIAVHDYGLAEATQQPYIVMDYLTGESLAAVVKREDHVRPERAVFIFLQACDALAHAHKKGVLHRDLKASNIMLVDTEGKRDVVKVVDFGIAKFMPSSGKQTQNLTQTGEIFGSPIYMSPEQCLGETLDPRSDIYSMGILMYEALTGEPPLMGETIIETMKMHVATKPPSFRKMRPDLTISSELESIVLKALQKAPDERWQSMQEFYDALEQLTFLDGGHEKRALHLAELQVQPSSSATLGVQLSNKAGSQMSQDMPYSVSRFGSKIPNGNNESTSKTSMANFQKQDRDKSGFSFSQDDDKIDLLRGNRRALVIGGVVLIVLVAAFSFFFAVTELHH